MKRTKLTFLITVLIALSLLIGCGGGGGGGDSGNPPKPTHAIVKLSAFGMPSSTPLGYVQATLHLPAGVWVQTDPASTVTSANVVVGSGMAGSAEMAYGVYSAATNTVGIYIVEAAGFSYWQGEFATITCTMSAAASPKASDFTVSDLIVYDTSGVLVTVLTPTLSVTFQ